MVKKLLTVLIVLAVLMAAAEAQAGEADWRDKIRYGADLRLREVYYDNALDLLDEADDESHFFRVRGRVWTGAGPFFEDSTLGKPNGLSAFLRVTAEPRWHLKRPFNRASVTHEEALLDNAWVQWARPGGMPFTLKAGRLDAVYGYDPPSGRGGWVIFDGTPLDGSRTIYHDGAIATLHLDDWDSQLDLLWFDNAARPEDRLDVIGEADLRTAESEVELLGAYFKKNLADAHGMRDMKVHTYYLYKEDQPISSSGSHSPTDYTNMVGALFRGKSEGNLDFYAEGGYQWGRHYNSSLGDRQDREAWGLTTEVGYTFADCDWKPRVSAGYEYLSGNDTSDTDTWGQWDPMLARWPHWSELFAYRWAFEGGLPGCYHNLQRFSLGTIFTPLNRPEAEHLKRLNAAIYYHYLLGNETPPAGMPPGYGDGDTRGSLVTGKLGWVWNDYINGHFLAEYFSPESFYADTADEAWFLRWEVVFKLPVPRKS